MVAQIGGVSGIGNFDSVSTKVSKPNPVDFSDSIFANIFSSKTDGKNETVILDGKSYPIQKPHDVNSPVETYAPRYKEVVIVNGEQYDVQNIPNLMNCEGVTKVVADGSTHKAEGHHHLDVKI